MDNLKQLVAYTIDKAKQLGAQDASCSAIHARELELSWRKAKIETLASAGQSALGIELYVDGRYGAYSTSDLRRESVSAFLEKNIAMTRLLDPDPARGLADPKRYENRSNVDLQLFDPKVAELSPENATDICKKLEDAVLTHKEIPITDAIAPLPTDSKAPERRRAHKSSPRSSSPMATKNLPTTPILPPATSKTSLLSTTSPPKPPTLPRSESGKKNCPPQTELSSSTDEPPPASSRDTSARFPAARSFENNPISIKKSDKNSPPTSSTYTTIHCAFADSVHNSSTPKACLPKKHPSSIKERYDNSSSITTPLENSNSTLRLPHHHNSFSRPVRATSPR